MKKNLFFTVIAAMVVMTGCSKNEVFDFASAGSLDNMEFESLAGKQTRATETTTVSLRTPGLIGMYGYKTTGDFKDAVTFESFFDKALEPLSYSMGKGWVTEKTYLWSVLGEQKLNIISIHPSLANQSDYTAPTTLENPKFDYTVQNDPQNQQDLIVSAALNLDKENTAGKINLTFKHILSQVLFKVQTDNQNFRIRIKELTVLGAKNQSTFTFSKVSPTKVAPAIGAWSATPTGNASYKYVEGGTAIYTNDIDAVMGDGGVLMILPQVAASDFKFEILYDVLDDISEDVISGDVKKEGEMTGMLMGKKYVYTLIIPNQDADAIRFDVTVDEWETPVIEHERKFEVLTLNKTTIEDKIKAYANLMQAADKNSYIHTVQVNGTVVAPFVINLSTLAAVRPGSKIVLDFQGIVDISALNTITVTAPATGWSIFPSSAVLAAVGKVTLTKN